MKEFGLGLIGCGDISSAYLHNLGKLRGVTIKAVADAKPEAAERQGARFGIAATSVDHLLARDDLDVVINLTIPRAHAEVSLSALRAGKHVFSEKPLAADFESARRLVEEAEARNLKLGCAPDTFLGASGRLTRRRLDEGAIGRPLSGAAFMMNPGMEAWHPNPEFFFKPGGGPLLDMGPYYVSALVNLLGPVTGVTALTSVGFAERIVTSNGPQKGDRIQVEVPTTAMALIEFQSGPHVMLMMSWDVWAHGHAPIELYGSEGTFRVPDPNYFDGLLETLPRDGKPHSEDSRGLPLGKANWPPDSPQRANYRGAGVAELVESLRNGTAHRTSGGFALHALEVLEAISESGRTRRPVAMATTIERPAALDEAAAAALWSV